MSRASLYREGARLPEQLSRLLFLEPVLQGRRVLEVGARSDAVARFLLELGAQRVVCASADKARIDELRSANTLEQVDFRVVRPGVLPGDDGAFDLVIDFTLADALAVGDTFRLTDIARLLSQDGFAVTAIESQSVRGLGALLGDAPTASVLASSRSAAGLSGAPGPVGYRQLIDALKLQFDLVQVYFQSLLLGYLFGSFDVEPSGDGVSPATSLMGNDPEPAGHYLFAFGNAVPLIEDVALVQVPFAELMLAMGKAPPDADATITPTAIAQMPLIEAREDPVPAAQDAREPPPERVNDQELLTLRREHAAHEHALSQIAVRTEELRGEVTQLLVALESRTRERDELAVFVEGLEAAVVARDAQLGEANLALAQLAVALEQRELERANDDDEQLRELSAERQVLVEQIARLEGEQSILLGRASAADEDRAQAAREIRALEDSLRDADAALSTHAAQVQALAAALDEAREAAIQATHLAEQRGLDGQRAQQAEQRAQQAEQRADQLDQRARTLESELDETRRIALHAQADAHGKEELKAREEELGRALMTADARVRDLEAEALKLAEGVKALMHEREDAHTRLAAETARLEGILDKERGSARERLEELATRANASEVALRAADEELRSARERVDALQKDSDGKEKRLKAAHAALEEARRDLVGAREGLQEVAGQRDTLQQVLRARERELEAARQQLLDVDGETRKLAEQADTHKKALAEARERLSSAEVERAHAVRRTEEIGQRVLERDGELSALRAEAEGARVEAARLHAALEDANRRLLLAEEEGVSLLSQVEEHERARAAAMLQADQMERELATRVLTEQGLVARAEDARRALADELVAARAALDEERERARTDALAQQEALALALGDAEERERTARDEATALERRAAMRDAEVESLRAVLDEAHATFDRERARSEMLDGMLLEAQVASSNERTRGELLRATLDEAQAVIGRERANTDLLRASLSEARSLLDVERARGDLFSEEILEAQAHIVVLREKMRVAMEHTVLQANASVSEASTKTELQHEILLEAQHKLSAEAARADLLQAELADARVTFQNRRDASEAALEGERTRSAAAINDADAARERLRSLEAALSEEKGNAMLLQASVDKFQALAESAERERDAVLGDLASHQARANAESARRLSVEEELAKLRVAHNQALAETQRLKMDAESERRAAVPELEAQIAALTTRLETVTSAAEQREAKIAEQSDLIARLKDRLVRIQDQP